MTGTLDRTLLHPLLQNVSVVLFDAGGTLVHPDWQRMARLVKANAGLDFDPVQMRNAFYERLRAVDLELQRELSELNQNRQPNWLFVDMFQMLGLDEAVCRRLTTTINLEHEKRHLWSERDPEVLDVLFELKQSGLRTGVISNTEDGRLEDSLKLADILSHFDLLIDSHVVGFRKPDATIFHLAVQDLDVMPHQAVYVGDSYGHDILGAQEAGLHAILFDPLKINTELQCARIERLSDLVGLKP
jgi:HAD superfamily hydrolase (TIGR01549 family)